MVGGAPYLKYRMQVLITVAFRLNIGKMKVNYYERAAREDLGDYFKA